MNASNDDVPADITDELYTLAQEWHECCGDIHLPLLRARDEIIGLRTAFLLADRAAAGRVARLHADLLDAMPHQHKWTIELLTGGTMAVCVCGAVSGPWTIVRADPTDGSI